MQHMNNEEGRLPGSSNGNSTAASLDGAVNRNAIEPEATAVANPQSPTCQPHVLYVDDEPA